MQAQEQIVSENKDFILLTQICKTLSLDSTNINPNADGRFNNKAMAVIAKEAANALAAFSKQSS